MYTMGTLLRHGSDAQKRAYLPKIASGELRLQAFGVTEPTTGSDTTQLKTTAIRKGDRYIVRGQKVWISRAEHSDLLLLVVRTTPIDQVKKRTEGLSILLVDLREAVGHGLTIRPIRTMMNHATTELFFDDLEVPVDDAGRRGRQGVPLPARRAERRADSDCRRMRRRRPLVHRAGDAVCEGARRVRPADRPEPGRAVSDRARAREHRGGGPDAHRAAELFDRGEPCGAEANMAKLLAADASWEAANVAVQTYGGFGFAEDYDIERKFRETRLYQVAPISTNLILAYVGRARARVAAIVFSRKCCLPMTCLLPLEGHHVVSLEQAVAAPFATRQLADLGARVIKIERPDGGDFARGYDTTVKGLSSYFVWLNRSKESLTLDLKRPDSARRARAAARARRRVRAEPGARRRRPARRSDAVLRARASAPHRVQRLRLRRRPGRTRRRRRTTCSCRARSGCCRSPGTAECAGKVGISVADIAAGMYAYSGILTALLARGTSRATARRSTCRCSTRSPSGWDTPAYYTAYGGRRRRAAAPHHASIAPYGPFRAGDGGQVYLGDPERARVGAVLRRRAASGRSVDRRSALPHEPAARSAPHGAARRHRGGVRAR